MSFLFMWFIWIVCFLIRALLWLATFVIELARAVLITLIAALFGWRYGSRP